MTGSDRGAEVWDSRGRRLARLTGRGQLRAVEWDASGRRLATLFTRGWEGEVSLWDEDGKRLAVLPGQRGGPASLAWHPKEGRLATGYRDKSKALEAVGLRE